jgi:hypothetical protein
MSTDMADKSEKRTIQIKLTYGETEALEIMAAANEEDLPMALFIRRGFREFMRAYRKQRRPELNIEMSAFDVLSGTDE